MKSLTLLVSREIYREKTINQHQVIELVGLRTNGIEYTIHSPSIHDSIFHGEAFRNK